MSQKKKDLLQKKFFNTESNIDNTRFGLQDYGLKWGSKTDELVNIFHYIKKKYKKFLKN